MGKIHKKQTCCNLKTATTTQSKKDHWTKIVFPTFLTGTYNSKVTENSGHIYARTAFCTHSTLTRNGKGKKHFLCEQPGLSI